MPSRKRKLTANSKQTSKKVKISSEDVGETQDTDEPKEIISADPQNKFYKLRDILAEKRGKYLIDWENDPETGEKYSPTWEPKAHANAEAVAYWNTKKSKPQQSTPLVPSQTHGAPPLSEQTLDSVVPPIRKTRHNTIDSSPPFTGEAETTPDKNASIFSLEDSQSPSIDTGDQPDIAVQISPHSSIDPRLYPQFSSQGLVVPTESNSKLEDRFDSGIGESSPTLSIPNWTIPDSQSLEGSCSCIPPQTQTDIDTVSTHVRTQKVYSTTSSPEPNDSTARVTDFSDPIEDFQSSENAASVTKVYKSRQSDLNCSVISQNLPPSRFEAIQLRKPEVPELKKPETTNGNVKESIKYEDSQQENILTLSSDSFQNSTPENSNLPTSRNSIVHQTNTIPREARSIQNRDPSINEGNNNPHFKAQALLAVNSLIDEPPEDIASSTDELWQGAQEFPYHKVQSYELSTYNSRKASTPVSAPIAPQFHSQGLIPQAFINPQDLIVSQDFETLGNSVLIQRDPNSQSSKFPIYSQRRKSIEVQTINPSAYSFEEISSSILREAPSQLPDVPASNPPPRPVVSSGTSMSDNTSQIGNPAPVEPQQRPLSSARPGPTLGEKLRNMRTQSAAKLAAKKAASRASNTLLQPSTASFTPNSALQTTGFITRRSKSPSLIPQRTSSEPVGDSRLEVRTVDVPLHPRATQMDSYTPSRPSKLALHREISQVQGTKAFDMPRLGHMEFVVPLPAPASVRDQYVAMINHVGKDIQRFHESESPDVELVSRMENFLREITNVTTHTDLVDDTVNDEGMLAADLAVWAKIRSSKFEFLECLIDRMRDRDEHVAIVAQGGRLLDIIETFLRGKHVGFDRPDILARSDPKETKGRLHISIIASGEEESSALPKLADLVIAFDGSFNAKEAQVLALRSHMLNVGQLSPVVHLLIYSSAEHIRMCLPESIAGIERLKLLVSCVTFAREQVGELQPEESTVDACAEEVSIFVESKLNADHWTLPGIKPIEIDGIAWDSSQDMVSTTQPEPLSFDFEPIIGSSKRSLDEMEEDSSTQKRYRTTPGIDVTHISDSMAQSSQNTINELQNTLQEAQSELNGAREALQGAQHEISNLKAAVTSNESRLRECINDLEALQTRYEDQYTVYHTLRHEKDDLAVAMAGVERKCELQAIQIESLKEDQRRVNGEVQIARDALAQSTIPERVELEKALADLREVSKTQDQLQRKVTSLTTDFDFTRQQYQAASTAAVESASRVVVLESENVELRRKASGQAVRLREINKTVEEERLRKRVEQLELTVKDREQQLERREKEVRGRGVQTRAGSVQPRSPKPSSQAGSRAASPMPGLLGVGMTKSSSGLRFG